MKRTQTFEPLAIVGMSCLFPKAQSLQDYWANIKEKVDCIKEVPETHWKKEDYYNEDKKCPDHVYTTNGGFLDPVDFNPAEWGIAPSDLDSIDTSQLLSLVVAKGALADAGYANKDFDRDNTSVILGLTGCLELVIPLGARLGHPFWRKAMLHAGIDENITNEVMDSIGKCYVGWQENSFPGLLGNCAAGRVANRLNLGGTNCVVDAACGSSLGALNMAAMELWTGKADMAITGGVDTFNDIFMFMCFCKTPALSKTGHARPFSADNDGTILGEGIGMVVLKRLSDAERDGDRIYACINAVGTSSDGKGKALYAPSVPGQVKALRRAYEQSGIDPHDVSMIEAHGTGTGAGDKVEVDALKEVYGVSSTNRPWCALGSVKSQIGHTKAAAGSANIIKAAMALYNKVIPPTIKISQPAASLAGEDIPFYLPNQPRPWITDEGKTRHAALSSMGFGGSNFHVVLSEYKSEKSEYDWERNVELITISGANASDVKTKLEAIKSAKEIRRFAAESRKAFNSADKARLGFVIDSTTDIEKIVTDISSKLDSCEDKDFTLPNGACFSTVADAGKIGIVFPGQGSQYPGMALGLMCTSPAAFNVFAEADKQIGKLDEAGNHLVDFVFPRPNYDEAKDALNGDKLKATDIAQPSLGAVSLGMYDTLKDFGIVPSGFAGHSYGELVSLCAAGLFDSKALALISRKRGQLMAQGSGDRGGMIAVLGSLSDVNAVVSEEKLDLVVANHNSNKQVVLSGQTSEIERAQKAFKAKKIRATVLNVAAAFHSKFVAEAAAPFYDFLKGFEFGKLNYPVYANTTAEVYPSDKEEARKLLGNQLANQVRFVDIINKMYADGIRTFVEVGPGAVLSGLIKNILDANDYRIITCDSSKGKNSSVFDFGKVLAQLAAYGYKLNLEKWQNGAEWLEKNPLNTKPMMAIKLCGANYRPKALLEHRAEIEKPATRKIGDISKVVATPTPVQPVAVQTPVTSAPMAAAQPISMNQNTIEALAALQIMQQETAELHKRFLEGQEMAQRALMAALGGKVSTLPVQAPAMPAAPVIPVTPAMPAVKPVVAKPIVSAPTVIQAQSVAKPAPVAVKPAVQAPVANNSKIKDALIAVVSEKTGYPAEMLNMDMDMEADLGIDSIKRVEIMSAMQERCPEAPVVQPDQLSNLRTLAQIMDVLGPTNSNAATAPVAAPAASNNASKIKEALIAVVSEKTGYPAEMLNMDMDMEADLGIDSIKRVEIMSAMQERCPEAPVVQPDQLSNLRTLAQIMDVLAPASANVTTMPVAAPAATAGNNGNAAKIKETLIAVVSEKTGYPAEMLNMDMDMEADLGIDSIKRVEIMSAMQERCPEAPVVQPDQLSNLRTLAQIMDVLAPACNAAQTVAAQVTVSKVAEVAFEEEPAEDFELKRTIIKAVETGKPEGLKLLNKGDKVVISNDDAELSKALSDKLAEKQISAETMSLADMIDGKFPKDAKALVVLASKPEKAVLNLWEDSSIEWLKDAFMAVKEAGATLKANKGILATVSRMDGHFGLASMTKNVDPVQGGLAGISKTTRYEWSDVISKAIDLDYRLKDNNAAAQLLAEEITVAGPMETGLSKSSRIMIEEIEEPRAEKTSAPKTFQEGDTIIVTGGARGVTAQTAIAFAEKYKTNMVLIGRSPLPEAEPAWLAALKDEAAIKRAIMENSDKKISPKELGAAYKTAMANREVLTNIAKLNKLGIKVKYYSASVLDEEQVGKVVAEIRSEMGNIAGIIHGAGVKRDKNIEDKTRDQLDDVINTKVKGLRNVLKATNEDNIKAIVLFSSFSGRQGRTGQVDYAMANEVLNKAAQKLKVLRNDCHVMAFNWGPWDGGMVDASLRKVFINEGIGLIPLKKGARCPIVELSNDNEGAVEIGIIGLIDGSEALSSSKKA